MPEIEWQCLGFTELTTSQLYDLLRLRAEVFVMEQDCVYQDLDNLDQLSLHVLGYDQDTLACYARVLPPGVKYTEPALGRIISNPVLRGMGLGRATVYQALAACEARWPGQSVRISAQQRLERFYREFAFETVSEPYDEDGIPHVEMLKSSHSIA